jgi:nickel transport protein
MFKLLKIVLVFLAISASIGASAHRIKLFAAEENGQIKGYGYAGSRRIVNSPVTVSLDGKVVTTLKTDSNGEFAFTPPQKSGSYLLELDTGDGHRAEYTVELAAVAEPEEVQIVMPPVETAVKTEAKTTSVSPRERDISRQLFALQQKLDQVENKIRLHDILGGIGYIIGIAGICFYFSAGKKKQ